MQITRSETVFWYKIAIIWEQLQFLKAANLVNPIVIMLLLSKKCCFNIQIMQNCMQTAGFENRFMN